MSIHELKLHHFRNVQQLSITANPHFNLIFGENGAGKTSILEAIHVLSHGKSFRSSKIDGIINSASETFTLYCRLINDVQVGVEKSHQQPIRYRHNGAKAKNLHAISSLLPCLLITTKSYRYFTDGPKLRRQSLNWGLYYANPQFMTLWRSNQKALQQRNALLKSRAPQAQLAPWTQEYISTATEIDQLYQHYIKQLQPHFQYFSQQFLQDMPLDLQYYAGWDDDHTLESQLSTRLDRDYQAGFTTCGIHRADLQVYYKKTPVHDYLSQGQQKCASYALALAQGQLLHQCLNQSPIYLIDDLPAELDRHKQQLVIDAIASMQSQCFITGIDPTHLIEAVSSYSFSALHMKDGQALT